MNISENNNQNLATPDQAVEMYIGEQFLEWLSGYISAQTKVWPELERVRNAKPKIEKIRKFLLQRFLGAEEFLGGPGGDPGLLGFAISNLSESSDPLAENALELLQLKRDNEINSEDASTQHNRWIKFLETLETPKDDIMTADPKEPTRNYVSELSDVYSNSEWQTAMGAFLAHERGSAQEYPAIEEMIKINTPAGTEAADFFAKQIEAEREYVSKAEQVLNKIAMDPESKNLLLDGVEKQLDARKNYYAALLKYIE